ncbi:AAA family ATPase [Undibacterium sp.]|jgi:pilus assembly protein CpaE|uniref:AAA family ATPase n=1 Tax=Undibacterium sp. TaxID=1914977 RepID=UPI002BF9E2B8|nr:AAA family ATPase [Undibacterium sp.]HTD04525.1 AAA family ATPase [Undibacterium sp.]
MDELRYTIVSPTRRRLDEIVRVLRSMAGAADVTAVEGGLEQLGTLANQRAPNVLIVDSAGDGHSDLLALQALGRLHPGMNFIVLCEQQSADFLIQAMRAGVREVLPLPLNAEALKGALERTRQHLGFSAVKNGKVLAFISCKGGSGATFLAANLAYALATHSNKKVALFDLNLQFGDALLFLSDQKPASTLADAARDIHRLDPAFLASSMVSIETNLSVLAAPEDPSHALEIKPDHIDTLLRLARNHYDFVILDAGRSLDAGAIKALDHADMIFVVLQITLPFIRDGKRLIDIFRTLDYPKNKIHLIVNRYQKGGDISLEDLQQSLGSKVLRTIPNHYEAAAASANQGIPIAKLARSSPVSKALIEWSEALAREPDQDSGSWISRVFKRA